MSDTKNIYQRINACMQEVEYVQKDATVAAGGPAYAVVTHDAVVGMVRKAMVKHGIVVEPHITESNIVQVRAPSADIKQHFYAARFDVHFVNIDDPKDRATVQVEAHAMDTQDKAPGKATSYAVKYAMLKLFSIETGEDEESRYAEVGAISEEAVAELSLLMNETDTDEAQFVHWLTSGKQTELASVLTTDYDRAKYALAMKAKRMAEIQTKENTDEQET